MSEKYVNRTSKSLECWSHAKRVMPEGITHGVRFFDPHPFYASRAQGSHLYDIDGNRYIDFWCGHGALILGHCPPGVVKAVQAQLEKGIHFGVSHELELELAEKITTYLPSAEFVRFASTGTEANMYAVRLSRTYTKRVKIGKFEGGWHGGYDGLHISVKPPFDIPASGGLTDGALMDTIALPYNDLEGVEKKIKNIQLACIVIEPVQAAGGAIAAHREFLKGLREICDKTDTLLIFDEVVTGFRLDLGSAQKLYGIRPDLTVLGKIIGGGFPIGATAGRRDVMEHLDHQKFHGSDFSYQSGTHYGNPMSTTAGLATLEVLEKGEVYQKINTLGDRARKDLQEIFGRINVDVQLTGMGSIFGCHFAKNPPKNVLDVSNSNTHLSVRFFKALLDEGIFMVAPGTLHGLVSFAHSIDDIGRLIEVAEDFAKTIVT